jgi:hypothetical protein
MKTFGLVWSLRLPEDLPEREPVDVRVEAESAA